ncbi:MAG: DUF11 domain-containing protein [Chloroflexota bacterium]|nr:DUF11 domain-containing protein [Chloroflexota bacterium]
MKEINHYTTNVLIPARFGLIALATVIGLTLTLAVVVAQAPNFDSSYKAGPQYAKVNDVIAYTIVTTNTGDTLVENVVLSESLPGGVVYVPGSCAYDDGYESRSCDPLNDVMWERDFAPGTSITTTFAATVTAGTLHWPLVNRAYLDWDSGRQELVFTTTVVAAIPDFEGSYKIGPLEAERDDVIAYTIVAVNSGDAVTNVVLSDPVPGGAVFAACSYDIEGGTSDIPCTPDLLWTKDLDAGDRITTTILFTMTAGTIRWPLRNCAYLSWYGIQEELCSTTLANPIARIYMPIVMRNRVWWHKHDNYEPNDTPSQAYGPLTSGEIYEAYIWNATDQDDYYHFTTSTGDDVYIELSNIPANCDYDLYVYYYDGQYHQIASSNQWGNVNEDVTFTPVAGETYYIRIYQSAGFSDEQTYSLRAAYQ